MKNGNQQQRTKHSITMNISIVLLLVSAAVVMGQPIDKPAVVETVLMHQEPMKLEMPGRDAILRAVQAFRDQAIGAHAVTGEIMTTS